MRNRMDGRAEKFNAARKIVLRGGAGAVFLPERRRRRMSGCRRLKGCTACRKAACPPFLGGKPGCGALLRAETSDSGKTAGPSGPGGECGRCRLVRNPVRRWHTRPYRPFAAPDRRHGTHPGGSERLDRDDAAGGGALSGIFIPHAALAAVGEAGSAVTTIRLRNR